MSSPLAFPPSPKRTEFIIDDIGVHGTPVSSLRSYHQRHLPRSLVQQEIPLRVARIGFRTSSFGRWNSVLDQGHGSFFFGTCRYYGVVCPWIGSRQLVSNCDRDDCREISLTRLRIVALVAVFIVNGAAWFAWIKKLVRTLKRDCSKWMEQRRSPNDPNDNNDSFAV